MLLTASCRQKLQAGTGPITILALLPAAVALRSLKVFGTTTTNFAAAHEKTHGMMPGTVRLWPFGGFSISSSEPLSYASMP